MDVIRSIDTPLSVLMLVLVLITTAGLEVLESITDSGVDVDAFRSSFSCIVVGKRSDDDDDNKFSETRSRIEEENT